MDVWQRTVLCICLLPQGRRRRAKPRYDLPPAECRISIHRLVRMRILIFCFLFICTIWMPCVTKCAHSPRMTCCQPNYFTGCTAHKIIEADNTISACGGT